jgi:hypothetical protein
MLDCLILLVPALSSGCINPLQDLAEDSLYLEVVGCFLRTLHPLVSMIDFSYCSLY